MLEREARRHGVSFKQALNDAIRRGLSGSATKSDKPYRVVSHETTLREGIDPVGFNKLTNELADESESTEFARTT